MFIKKIRQGKLVYWITLCIGSLNIFIHDLEPLLYKMQKKLYTKVVGFCQYYLLMLSERTKTHRKIEKYRQPQLFFNGTHCLLCAKMKDLFVLISNISYKLTFGSAVFALNKFKVALNLPLGMHTLP